LKKLGSRFSFAFAPHTLGLQHRDQPFMSIEGKPHDLQLQEGMVLSVDCPCLSSGINGSIHFEDLVLLTANGAQTLHPVDDYLIVV
jgi:Xaa-Pro aminopeptidase